MGERQSTIVISSETYPRTLESARRCHRRHAEPILRHHLLHQSRLSPVELGSSHIRIVCISDTHNQRPDIPPGDILIHAGDLTDNGSFDEMQAGLDWLAAQPHAHKIFVAGNHDVLLDESFLARYPERRYGSSKTLHNLVWPDNVVYLNNNSTTLEISNPTINHDGDPGKHSTFPPVALNAKPNPNRTLKIYGSPYTPEYVPSAFQYPRSNVTFWDNKSLLTQISLSLMGHQDCIWTRILAFLWDVFYLAKKSHAFGRDCMSLGISMQVMGRRKWYLTVRGGSTKRLLIPATMTGDGWDRGGPGHWAGWCYLRCGVG